MYANRKVYGEEELLAEIYLGRETHSQKSVDVSLESESRKTRSYGRIKIKKREKKKK